MATQIFLTLQTYIRPFGLIFLFVGMLFSSHFTVHGQALDQIGKEKNPIKISGGLSASQIVYAQSGLDANRRSPYNYFLSGNLNVSIWGFSIPVSFTYSNQRTQFQQPFNQFSLTPTYKWAKFYAGYSSMTFSPYTLNGHIFLGGGVQLTPPGLFRCSAMFGRLNQAVEEDTSNTAVIPYYLRWGGGFKVGVGKGGDGADVTFFMAKDDPNSLSRPIIKNQLRPMENAVLGFSFSKILFNKLSLSGEYAASALTSDATSAVATEKQPGAFAIVPTFNFKTSTAVVDAYKAAVNYSAEKFTVGVGYERINPGYRTLGAYYFNDDLENITGNGSLRILGNKMSLTASVGTQRNNLKSEKMSQMNRFVGSFSVTYSPSPRTSFSASYSNFQSFTSVRKLTPIEQQQFQLDPRLNGNPDTLRFVQLTQSANASMNFLLSKPENSQRRSNLSVNLTYQTSGEKQGEGSPEFAKGTNFYNGSLSFSRSIVPQAFSGTAGFSANYNTLSSGSSLLLSPSITIGKGFLNKTVRPTATLTWSSSYANGKKSSDIFNFRLGAGYTYRKKHTLSTNLTITSRNPFSLNQNEPQTRINSSFTEYTWNLGYSFQF